MPFTPRGLGWSQVKRVWHSSGETLDWMAGQDWEAMLNLWGEDLKTPAVCHHPSHFINPEFTRKTRNTCLIFVTSDFSCAVPVHRESVAHLSTVMRYLCEWRSCVSDAWPACLHAQRGMNYPMESPWQFTAATGESLSSNGRRGVFQKPRQGRLIWRLCVHAWVCACKDSIITLTLTSAEEKHGWETRSPLMGGDLRRARGTAGIAFENSWGSCPEQPQYYGRDRFHSRCWMYYTTATVL